MGSRVVGAAFALVLSASAGCATNRSIVVSKDIDRKLGTYSGIAVAIQAGDPKYQSYVEDFGTIFLEVAKDEEVSPAVALGSDPKAKGAPLSLKLTLVGAEEGSKLARTFNLGGEAEFVIDASLTEAGGQKPLGSFRVKGNSSRTSHTSVNGVDTSMHGVFDKLTARALEAASEQICEYLNEHK